MEGLKEFDFKGIDIANGKEVIGKLEMIDLNEGSTTPQYALVINTGVFKSICKRDSIEIVKDKFIIKAEKWDKLSLKIDKYYNEENDSLQEEEGNLLDIGEAAASAFGYL